MKVLAVVIGLLGALVLLYSMSIPAIFAGSYFMGGVILMLAAIALYIYSNKAEREASDTTQIEIPSWEDQARAEALAKAATRTARLKKEEEARVAPKQQQ